MEKKYSVEFLFTYPKKFKIVAWIIKTRIGREYDHVAVRVDTGPIGLYDIYQASHGSVNIIENENFQRENNILKTVKLEGDREAMLRVLRFLKKQTGKTYSVWGAIACTVRPLRMIGLGKDGDKSFICSEYGMRALEEFVGKKLYTGLDADYVDPEDFELFLEKFKTL